MKRLDRRSFLGLLGSGIAAGILATSDPPKVPLRVTYYYLPG